MEGRGKVVQQQHPPVPRPIIGREQRTRLKSARLSSLDKQRLEASRREGCVRVIKHLMGEMEGAGPEDL